MKLLNQSEREILRHVLEVIIRYRYVLRKQNNSF